MTKQQRAGFRKKGVNLSARLLNIGCGAVWNDAWINLDGAPAESQILRHDITKGLPFESNSIDACYASHVLEHLTQAQAVDLVAEMHRILRPAGIVRLVVPDLEAIVALYCQLLADVSAGNLSREADYDWVMLELLDQVVREFPGGEMGRYLASSAIPNRAFVTSRIGDEADRFWSRRKMSRISKGMHKLRTEGWRWALSIVRVRIAAWLVYAVAGPRSRAAFNAGTFRVSGEVHRWMYDRFSLGRLLKGAGFAEVSVCSAFESRIPGFASYGLDTIDGRLRKPDSLFIEASKR